jgi:zinc protease
VRANNEPQNRAELMLVVSAGSVLEDDDQMGLAHFAEHMNFNGTKNFPKNELINYLESIGMKFGPEINAYTSFDQTVYMIKVPLDNEEYIEKGLQVLYDWACQVTDSYEEIEKERGIIHEEWRGGQGANERMMQEWLPVFLHKSKYAERLPIGKIDIIDNCPPEALRRFRSDWYRPDLQAVIVVGDFDQKEMTERIKKKFSEIPAKESPRKKENYDIPGHDETFVKIVTDKEATYSIANVYIKHPMTINETIGGYRDMIIQSYYNSMINDRLSELAQSEIPPFIYGQTGYGGLFGPADVYTSMAVAHPGKITEGLKSVLLENERVKKYGFTETELERAKASMLRHIETAYNERDKRKSAALAKEYSRNFLMRKEPVPGIEKEYEYYNTLTPGIKLEEVNSLAAKWITDENRVVIITAPEKEGTITPTEEEIKNLLEEIKGTELAAYKDETTSEPLMATIPTAGKIIEEKNIETAEALEWTLSNGSKVVVKQTDFKDDQILFTAYAPGGNSLYNQSDDVSADFAATIMDMSGIADFKLTTLEKMLADKVVGVTPFIRMLTQGFNGSSSVADIETMLQLVNLYFTNPRINETAFTSYTTRIRSQLSNREVSPEAAFSDTFRVVSANYHPRMRPLTEEIIDEADFARIESICKERFTNAGNFTYFFVGNIDIATLKPLVETYLASLPPATKEEEWIDLGIRKPKGVIEKVVNKGTEPKSIHYILFHGELKHRTKNMIELNALGEILSTRLLENIREDKSSVYYIGAKPSFNRFPEPKYEMMIYYGTSPQKIEELKEEVFSEINDLIKNGPTAEEINKAREKMLRSRELSLRDNSYWLATLKSYYLNKKGNFKSFNKYEDAIGKLSQKSLKKAAKQIWDFNNYISVTLMPEKGYENE